MKGFPVAALDLGKQRIGIAVCASPGSPVIPVGVIERASLAIDLARLNSELQSRAIERVIVGLPLNMDGSEGAAARHAHNFADRLRQMVNAQVELFDERLTSFEAEVRLRTGATKRGIKSKAAVDAVAAAIILEGWLVSQGKI